MSIGLRLRERVRQIRHSVWHSLKYIFSPANLLISLCLIATLFLFWIIPAGNTDSAGYHYLSILWYEKYKVVPGLANIHGRLAFNPISFIIQAAYSFTDPAGQSIYPLNGVIIGLFFSWLLIRMLKRKKSPAGLAYGVLIIMLYRALLINISSPSPDALVDVCMSYSMILLFEILLSGEVRLSQVVIPCLIILYSLTAKLYSFPMLLVLPFLFFLLPKNERKGALLLKVFGICLFMFVPWMIRNYILSGYIIYPLPWFNFFHPDWQVSFNVLQYNYYDGAHRIAPSSSASSAFLSWLANSIRIAPVNGLQEAAAILSPLCWILLYKKTKLTTPKVFGIWLIIYAGIWIWLFAAPVFRFGAVLISLSLLLPFLACLPDRSSGKSRLYSFLTSLLFICAALYYIKTGSSKPTTYAFSLKDCWLYPLKDGRYKNNKADFPYTTLRSGVKLYMEDGIHECINTELTCRVYYSGEIEMRGASIDQGFKIVKDETLPYSPFIIIKR
ncbi:MAG TPA: hypothetical protein VNS58_18350 [Puia sp.]|nr:hypothetical protein [Puia sp.]